MHQLRLACIRTDKRNGGKKEGYLVVKQDGAELRLGETKKQPHDSSAEDCWPEIVEKSRNLFSCVDGKPSRMKVKTYKFRSSRGLKGWRGGWASLLAG